MKKINLQDRQTGIAAVRLLKNHIAGEKVLNQIQVEALKNIIKDHSKSFSFFTIFVLGFDRYPKTHEKWCNKQENDFKRKRNFIRLKPRGTGKTTIYGIAQILWIWAIFSQKIRIFYSSANSLLLEEVYDTLKRILSPEYESFYYFVFGICLDKSVKNTSDIMNITGRGDSKGFSLTLRTAGSSTAGVHPNIIMVDDPSDKSDRTSEAIRRDKKLWADTLRPLLHPMKLDNGFIVEHFMVIATFWHFDDTPHYFISQNENLPQSEKFDIDIESLEHQGTGKNMFPEIYTQKKINTLKAQMGYSFFSCQMNNVVLSDANKIFDLDKFHFADISNQANQENSNDRNIINIRNGSNYCFIDPAKGRNKDSDFPAVIYVNKQNDKIFIFDAITDIKPFSEVLRDVARMNKAYGVIRTQYEDNGTNLIEETLARHHQEIKHYCEITGVWEGRNKEDRIRNMQPVLVSGDVIFRADWQTVYPELINQIIYFPAWTHDDFPDVLEKAIRNLVQKDFQFGVFTAH